MTIQIVQDDTSTGIAPRPQMYYMRPPAEIVPEKFVSYVQFTVDGSDISWCFPPDQHVFAAEEFQRVIAEMQGYMADLQEQLQAAHKSNAAVYPTA